MRALYALALAAVISATHAAETVQVLSFAPNPGNLRMFKFVPAGLTAGAPLVVALHGCTQTAYKFDDESGWTGLADQLRFALLLPEQQQVNNERFCFNWFLADHNRRGQGEAASIIAMVDEMKVGHGIDPNRIFVTGLSAGGGMAAAMLAAYPDVFRGGAIIAGIPFGRASTGGNAFLAWARAYKSIGSSTGTARAHGLLGNAGSAPTAVFSARRLCCEALLSGVGCSVRQRDRTRLCGQRFHYGRGVMTALSIRKTLWN